MVGGVAYTYNKAGETLTADNTGPDSSAIASYTYTYTTTGNVQTEHVALAAMSNGVTLAADYDYNNNMTTLAANINSGSVTPTFNSDGTISFSGGVDDFENTYFYDTLGDMTGIEQIANPNTGDGASSHNDVQAKNVAMSYDSDERLTGVDMYQSDGTSDLVSSAAYGYDADSDLTSLTYYANTAHTGTPLAGYHWDCNAAGVVSDEYSRNDSSDGSSAADTYGSGSDWGKTAYTYDRERTVDRGDVHKLQHGATRRPATIAPITIPTAIAPATPARTARAPAARLRPARQIDCCLMALIIICTTPRATGSRST